MAYSTSNPPVLINTGGIGGVAVKQWVYSSTDAASVVDGNSYITNARDLGMKVGDQVLVSDTDASPRVLTSHIVQAINADGSANLSDGVTVGSTNSD